MERIDAERVFTLIADIGGDVRGRIVSERWWLIWIVMGIQILLTSSITQLLLWSGENRAFFMERPFTANTAQPISHVYIQECSYIWKPMVAIPVDRLQAVESVNSQQSINPDGGNQSWT